MNELILLFTFALSFLLTLYGTPIAQKVAAHYNLLDFPDGKLKKQQTPIPYMGGVIVYFAFISPLSLLFDFNQELLGILFASSILLIVGLFDDFKALTPGVKFFFQIVATYILIKSGISIRVIFIPQWLNTILSFAWILTAINAFNIIDIMDGLAPSIGALASLTIFVISLYDHDFLISILSLSLAASLLCFLRFNWEPARIYLGDAGSMVLGLVIGSLAVMTHYTPFNRLAFLSALIVLGLPLFDLVYVTWLRLLKGRSPFRGSPDHFALRLKKRFNWSSRQTVIAVIAIQPAAFGRRADQFFLHAAGNRGQHRLADPFFPDFCPLSGSGQNGMILIIGAGISGLGTALSLKEDFLVLEKSQVAGGLAGEYTSGSWWFPHGGHYFHFQGKEEIRHFLETFHSLRRYQRNSKVFMQDRFIAFPLQFHLAALPAKLKKEITDQMLNPGQGAPGADANLESFLKFHFGDTLFNFFFKPFLSKFYGQELSRLLANMDKGSLPVPDRRQVLAGAAGQRFSRVGYNPSFYYPRRGLRALIADLTRPIAERITFQAEALRIDSRRKTVQTNRGTYRYEFLVNTMPLNEFLRRLDPPDFTPTARQLRHISTLVVNAVLEKRHRRFHWLYLSEPRFPFYRVGYYPDAARPLVYLEKTLLPGEHPDKEQIRRQTRFTLMATGMIRSWRELLHLDTVCIPVSYILFDRRWPGLVPPLLETLRNRGIYSIGRYGSWNYTSMADDLQSARRTAARLDQH